MTLRDVTNSNNVSRTIVNGVKSFLISWINNYTLLRDNVEIFKLENQKQQAIKKMILAFSELLEYLDSHKPEEWPLSQFLLLYRDKIFTAPFHDDWHALDGAWTRRFIRAVQERNEKIDLKTKIETKLVTDKEGLHTLHTSVQSHGERVRNSYDNCEEANEEYQNLSSNKTNLRMLEPKELIFVLQC
ncbi:hypothetical protein RhiirA1_529672 [Rhizophagus irregularis]|uniref:Uncharacterized protein n=1 Tax=Rhizophagus irregularis TaxID=588596 RepID=A0A2N0SFL8_9GLOM|nr:hypothetical protein RhiirA1_529672 [Rhizophagus irregularis]